MRVHSNLCDREMIDPAAHFGLVKHIARRMHRRLPMHDVDDFVGAGSVGLMEAAKSFDASRGLTFSTFAARRIQGAILDELRRMHGRADKPGGSARLAAISVGVEQLDATRSDDGGEARALDRVAIEEMMRALSPRERAVVWLYHIADVGQREIGETLGVTEARVCQIRRGALRKMKAAA